MSQPSTPVTVSNIDIPFGRLVLIMLKWMLAAIPALILFYIVIGALVLLGAGMGLGLSSLTHH
jgi:hypothetical protein